MSVTKVLSCCVGAIHELPLHSVAKTVSAIGVFQKMKLLQNYKYIKCKIKENNFLLSCQHPD